MLCIDLIFKIIYFQWNVDMDICVAILRLFLYWENCSWIEMDVLYFSYSKCQSEILVLSNIPVLNHKSIGLLSELYLW